jgi:hypothetical protein
VRESQRVRARAVSARREALAFAAKRAGALTESQAQYPWKQFNIHKIKTREPPELDFEPETPHTLNDLVSLRVNDLGYSLADLAKMLLMYDQEVAKTYSIEMPGQGKVRATSLRIVQ